MISKGYSIDPRDVEKYKSFRRSDVYSLYLNSVANSPLFKSIMKEHVQNIDISSDVKQLKRDGTLGDNVKEDVLNTIFKNTLSKLAVILVADSIILKEIEEVKIDKIINDLEEDSTITYLLGMAPDKYYKEADKLRKNGKLEPNDIAMKGLVEYEKRKGKLTQGINQVFTEQETLTTQTTKETPIKQKLRVLDVDSNDISL